MFQIVRFCVGVWRVHHLFFLFKSIHVKILQLCPRVPFPPVDGGLLGLYNMAKALHHQGAKVKMLAFNTSKHFVNIKDVPDEFVKTYQLETVYLDNNISIFSALKNLFSKQSYHISRFISEDFAKALIAILEKENFDIIQLDYLTMAVYIDVIRKHSKAKLIYRAHNVEYRIWERLAESENNFVKRWYLKLLAKRLKNFEFDVINKVDAIVALTEEETKIFRDMGSKVPICIAPTCFFIEEFKPVEYPKEFSLFHIGSMDWMPNTTGLKWFLKEVWTKVNVTHPQIKLYLAGNKMPKEFLSLNNENCHVQGRVEDAKQFIAEHSVMIVPLLAGSGIRVKIVEGMAMGKPIISTSQGAEGLHYENRKNILIADTPEEFYDAIIECYQSVELRKTLGENARQLAFEYYDMNKVGAKVYSFYQSLY